MVNSSGNRGKRFNPTGKVAKKSPFESQRRINPGRAEIKYGLIGMALIAIGIGIFFMLFQSEEKRVKKQFSLLSEGVSKEAGENIFTLDQKIKKIGSLFNDTCEIIIPAHSISGRITREEITGYAARGRLHLAELRLTFHDFIIAFPQEGEARVHLTARLTGKTTTGEVINEAHEIDCLLRKTEKKWMFSSIEVVEVLKK
jgi:hypothetical protein